jgi:hypothetical protein
MKNFNVRYEVNGYVYETIVRTSTSGAALLWVKYVFPDAENVSVIE